MDDLVAEVAAVVDRMVEADPASLSDGQSVVGLHRQLERLAAVTARASARFDNSEVWYADGAHTAAAWIATECRIPRSNVQRELHLGHKVKNMPVVEQAWLAGELSSSHVRLLAGAHNSDTADLFARDEELLCHQAGELHFHQFVNAVKYWQYRADPDRSERDAEKMLEGRQFHHSQSVDGEWFSNGAFDSIGGSVIDKRLRSIEEELFEADWAEAKARLGREPTRGELGRTPAQRRADAMVEMARRAGATPKGGRMPEPLFTVLVGYETFHGMICQLANNTVVTPGSLIPYLDDAWIERIVFESPSRVIDVGARRRLFDGATRRAIEVAGQECFDRTCDTPAEDCQIDHIQPWAAGGPTVQENGRPS